MVLHLCMSQSTAHGLGNFANEPHKSGKVIWFLLTILTFAFFVYHTILLYGQLTDETVIVSTHQFAIDFIQPDILFCSDRIFARDYINNPPSDEYDFMLNVSEKIQKFDQSYCKKRKFSNTLIWDSLNWHDLYTAFYHRRHQLFLRITCNLKDIDIDVSSLKPEMNLNYFACYRFNASSCKLKTPYDSLVIKFFTYIYGINITYSKLNVLINNRTIDTYLFEQRDPIDEMEDGMHIFFLRPNEQISSSTLKVTAETNKHTYIRIKSTKYDRIPTKTFQCQPEITQIPMYNLLEKDILKNPLNVTEESVCIQKLFQENIYKFFNCVSTQFPIPRSIPPNFTFCGNIFNPLYKPTNYMAFWTNPNTIIAINKQCKKRQLCTIIRHHSVVNYNNWPRKSTLRNIFKHDIPMRLNHVSNNNLTSPGLYEALNDFSRRPSNLESWMRNFIKVSISPGEFKSTLVEESLSYTLKNFFSDIGGIMGFYMGASLLTLCEVFRLIHYMFHATLHWREEVPGEGAKPSNDVTKL